MQSTVRWHSDWLNCAVVKRFWEHLGQTKVMQIRQRETTHEICCLAAQYLVDLILRS